MLHGFWLATLLSVGKRCATSSAHLLSRWSPNGRGWPWPRGRGLQTWRATYPFPIRAGLQGRITLPENLTRREADRISAFIKTLAMEDEAVYEHSPRAITGVVMDDDE